AHCRLFSVGRRGALLADAALAVAAMTGEVQVEVVAVIEVVGRAEHGREDAARPAMHVAQEIALSQSAPPAALDIDRASAGQAESRDVDGIGVAVLGEMCAVDVVHRPAGIGGGYF